MSANLESLMILLGHIIMKVDGCCPVHKWDPTWCSMRFKGGLMGCILTSHGSSLSRLLFFFLFFLTFTLLLHYCFVFYFYFSGRLAMIMFRFEL